MRKHDDKNPSEDLDLRTPKLNYTNITASSA
uniref:Clone 1404 transcribed RNA sequence n=1 Tax=Plectreurys tristis TaxID=33319 RepID=A0A0C4W5X9_PLETR|nr:hypothetical protein [Plectreurys tristis]